MSFGVQLKIRHSFSNVTNVMFYHALASAKKVLNLEKGDKVVLTGGPINGKTGNTNTIKVETL